MSIDPQLACKNICILTGGETAHHKTNLNMSMCLKNSKLALNVKEKMSVFGMHFNKVLNNHRPVDYTVLDLIKQKPCLTSIDTPITLKEVKWAINKLKKGKLPGLNGIPPEALKAIDNTSRRTVHRHVCNFFEGRVDHEGWHKSQCIPVPKWVDLNDPNKWHQIMLMDICSKVFSSVMMTRAFTLLHKHGTCFQFGGTPKIGCRDGLFTLKALLNTQHNHNLASYIGFVDLVKAYDTVNHKLLIDILRRYGAPPKFTTTIEMVYCNNTCVLKFENEVTKIPQSIGVHQGDNMVHILFLFLMTAFAKTLELVWKQHDIPILSVMMATGKNIIKGKICSHTPAMFCSKKLTAFEILQCLYVDDGAFPFGLQEDLQQGMELINIHYAQFGLEMHIGCGTSESKTKCVFFPPPHFFRHLDPTHTATTTIQQAFRQSCHTHNNNKHNTRRITEPDQTTTLHTLTTMTTRDPLSSTHFPIGCHITVASSHPTHANTTGRVT
jgi:hypothetical protein